MLPEAVNGDARMVLARYYQTFIKLSSGDEYWINRAKEIIERLQKGE